MRSARMLVEHDDFRVRAVDCAGGSARWSPPEFGTGYGLVLVRSGRFRIRHRGVEALAEPTTAYVQVPGGEVEFAHTGGGDTCTAVRVTEHLWHAVVPNATAVTSIPVDGRVQLAHLQLLRAALGRDMAYATTEQLVGLLARATGGDRDGPGPPRPARRAAGARLALAASEAIAADDPCARGLVSLAGSLGVSPYHLSRTFVAHTGQSLTRYRNRVRVSRALQRLDAGERDLARLAVELGFADQAHLTRTVKAHVGHPPGALRALLHDPTGG